MFRNLEMHSYNAPCATKFGHNFNFFIKGRSWEKQQSNKKINNKKYYLIFQYWVSDVLKIYIKKLLEFNENNFILPLVH
jgi:hypothetical protein